MTALELMMATARRENARLWRGQIPTVGKQGPRIGRPRCPKVAARRERVVDLRKSGMKVREIAARMGVSVSVVKIDLFLWRRGVSQDG